MFGQWVGQPLGSAAFAFVDHDYVVGSDILSQIPKSLLFPKKVTVSAQPPRNIRLRVAAVKGLRPRILLEKNGPLAGHDS